MQFELENIKIKVLWAKIMIPSGHLKAEEVISFNTNQIDCIGIVGKGTSSCFYFEIFAKK